MKYLLKNGLVFYQNQLQKKDIKINDNIIEAIQDRLEDNTYQLIDCSNKLISYGFIDLHCHLRTPGQEYKETILTGTKAALKGGYTTIINMANTNPVIDNLEIIDNLASRIEKEALINVYSYATLTKNLKGKEINDYAKLIKHPLIVGFSDDGKGIQDETIMENILKRAKENNALVVAHLEDESVLDNGVVNEGIYAKGLKGINKQSEYNHLIRDLSLLEKINTRYHVCHVSIKESIDLIRQAKEKGIRLSCEVTPHHLTLIDEDVKNANFKMNPPLRSDIDRLSLIDALNEGIIDVIATDHAPHSDDEKSDLVNGLFGIIGLEHAFAVCYTNLVKKGLVKLETILKALTNGYQIINIDKRLEVNYPADLVIIDLAKSEKVERNNIISKSHNTPFLGETLYGIIEKVILKGEMVYEKK